MGRLCCNCLNIAVHHSSRAEDGRRVPAARLLPEGCKDRLVDKELAEIELDVAGVTIVSAWATGFYVDMQYRGTYINYLDSIVFSIAVYSLDYNPV